MKRFVIAAVAAAALAVPAGASADTGTAALDLQAIEAACPTPVFDCVDDALATAFGVVTTAVNTAEFYVDYAVGLISKPPPVNQVCYLIWGQPCTTAL